ncbi:hypothetical protein MKX01_026427 [Papaver californicum]|nr:hypothetical protein MKX01_026427 [Papaver californicum]
MAFGSLEFTVRKREPELINSAKPTPYEYEYLLGEAPGGKLLVEWSGQGVLFVDADASLNLLLGGDFLKPPFPYLEQLLPLILAISFLTRLLCGGSIVGFGHNRTISDAQGLHQLKRALAEIDRGERSPSLSITVAHREYDVIPNDIDRHPALDDMVQHSFFGPKELAALRLHVPPHLQACTTFELLTAWLWRFETCGEVVYSRQTIGINPTLNHWMSSSYMSYTNNIGAKGSLAPVC